MQQLGFCMPKQEKTYSLNCESKSDAECQCVSFYSRLLKSKNLFGLGIKYTPQKITCIIALYSLHFEK